MIFRYIFIMASVLLCDARHKALHALEMLHLTGTTEMSFKTLTNATVLATSLLGAVIAQATPITFNFGNGASEANATYSTNLGGSNGGVDLNVSAYRNTLLGWKSTYVSQWGGGLGVSGGASNTQVDGSYRSEMLVFDFSQAISLDSISFVLFDDNDQATILNYDAKNFWDIYVTDIDKSETATNGGINTFSFTQDLFTSLLGVLALDYNDNFTVLSMTVSTVSAAVPEPSIIALFGVGLIGLGLARRRSASVSA